MAKAIKEKQTKGECPDIFFQLFIKLLLQNTNLSSLVLQWNVIILNKRALIFSRNCGTLFDFGFTTWFNYNPFFHIF